MTTPDLSHPLGTPAQRIALTDVRTRHVIASTYRERCAPHRLFAYTGEFNGVEISIYPDGMVLGEPDPEGEWS